MRAIWVLWLVLWSASGTTSGAGQQVVPPGACADPASGATAQPAQPATCGAGGGPNGQACAAPGAGVPAGAPASGAPVAGSISLHAFVYSGDFLGLLDYMAVLRQQENFPHLLGALQATDEKGLTITHLLACAGRSVELRVVADAVFRMQGEGVDMVRRTVLESRSHDACTSNCDANNAQRGLFAHGTLVLKNPAQQAVLFGDVTPFECAVAHGHVQAMKLLIQGGVSAGRAFKIAKLFNLSNQLHQAIQLANAEGFFAQPQVFLPSGANSPRQPRVRRTQTKEKGSSSSSGGAGSSSAAGSGSANASKKAGSKAPGGGSAQQPAQAGGGGTCSTQPKAASGQAAPAGQPQQPPAQAQQPAPVAAKPHVKVEIKPASGAAGIGSVAISLLGLRGRQDAPDGAKPPGAKPRLSEAMDVLALVLLTGMLLLPVWSTLCLLWRRAVRKRAAVQEPARRIKQAMLATSSSLTKGEAALAADLTAAAIAAGVLQAPDGSAVGKGAKGSSKGKAAPAALRRKATAPGSGSPPEGGGRLSRSNSGSMGNLLRAVSAPEANFRASLSSLVAAAAARPNKAGGEDAAAAAAGAAADMPPPAPLRRQSSQANVAAVAAAAAGGLASLMKPAPSPAPAAAVAGAATPSATAPTPAAPVAPSSAGNGKAKRGKQQALASSAGSREKLSGQAAAKDRGRLSDPSPTAVSEATSTTAEPAVAASKLQKQAQVLAKPERQEAATGGGKRRVGGAREHRAGAAAASAPAGAEEASPAAPAKEGPPEALTLASERTPAALRKARSAAAAVVAAAAAAAKPSSPAAGGQQGKSGWLHKVQQRAAPAHGAASTEPAGDSGAAPSMPAPAAGSRAPSSGLTQQLRAARAAGVPAAAGAQPPPIKPYMLGPYSPPSGGGPAQGARPAIYHPPSSPGCEAGSALSPTRAPFVTLYSPGAAAIEPSVLSRVGVASPGTSPPPAGGTPPLRSVSCNVFEAASGTAGAQHAAKPRRAEADDVTASHRDQGPGPARSPGSGAHEAGAGDRSQHSCQAGQAPAAPAPAAAPSAQHAAREHQLPEPEAPAYGSLGMAAEHAADSAGAGDSCFSGPASLPPSSSGRPGAAPAQAQLASSLQQSGSAGSSGSSLGSVLQQSGSGNARCVSRSVSSSSSGSSAGPAAGSAAGSGSSMLRKPSDATSVASESSVTSGSAALTAAAIAAATAATSGLLRSTSGGLARTASGGGLARTTSGGFGGGLARTTSGGLPPAGPGLVRTTSGGLPPAGGLLRSTSDAAATAAAAIAAAGAASASGGAPCLAGPSGLVQLPALGAPVAGLEPGSALSPGAGVVALGGSCGSMDAVLPPPLLSAGLASPALPRLPSPGGLLRSASAAESKIIGDLANAVAEAVAAHVKAKGQGDDADPLGGQSAAAALTQARTSDPGHSGGAAAAAPAPAPALDAPGLLGAGLLNEPLESVLTRLSADKSGHGGNSAEAALPNAADAMPRQSSGGLLGGFGSSLLADLTARWSGRQKQQQQQAQQQGQWVGVAPASQGPAASSMLHVPAASSPLGAGMSLALPVGSQPAPQQLQQLPLALAQGGVSVSGGLAFVPAAQGVALPQAPGHQQMLLMHQQAQASSAAATHAPHARMLQLAAQQGGAVAVPAGATVLMASGAGAGGVPVRVVPVQQAQGQQLVLVQAPHQAAQQQRVFVPSAMAGPRPSIVHAPVVAGARLQLQGGQQVVQLVPAAPQQGQQQPVQLVQVQVQVPGGGLQTMLVHPSQLPASAQAALAGQVTLPAMQQGGGPAFASSQQLLASPPPASSGQAASPSQQLLAFAADAGAGNPPGLLQLAPANASPGAAGAGWAALQAQSGPASSGSPQQQGRFDWSQAAAPSTDAGAAGPLLVTLPADGAGRLNNDGRSNSESARMAAELDELLHQTNDLLGWSSLPKALDDEEPGTTGDAAGLHGLERLQLPDGFTSSE